MTPVPGLATCMSEGDDLNFGVAFSVDHEVREPPKRDSACAVLRSHARHRITDAGLTPDQVHDSSLLGEKLCTQTRAPVLVPGHGSPELLLRRRVKPPPLHLLSSCVSIRRRIGPRVDSDFPLDTIMAKVRYYLSVWIDSAWPKTPWRVRPGSRPAGTWGRGGA